MFHALLTYYTCLPACVVNKREGLTISPLLTWQHRRSTKSLRVTDVAKQADLHGAIIKVVRSSSCPQMVGLEGVLTRETKSTFEIVTKDGSARIVRKDGCTVNVVVNGMLFSLEGTRMIGRTQLAAGTT